MANGSSELISRWLYNVEAVKEWSARVNKINGGNSSEDGPPGEPPIAWWNTTTKIPEELKVQDFIGQGRCIEYCGLPHAVMAATDGADFGTVSTDGLDKHAAEVAAQLRKGKPLAWYVVAALSLPLVWTAIMSAFTVSFTVSPPLVLRVS